MSGFHLRSRCNHRWLILLTLSLLAVLPGHALGAPLTVMNTNDSAAGSLRQAINDSSAANDDTIIFAPGVTGTITLTSELPIAKNLTIIGPGARNLTISGNGAFRGFSISSGIVNLSGLTIANGNSVYGGGIYNAGTLTVSTCTLTGNMTSNDGGGIYNIGFLMVKNSALFGNSANKGDGGAIANQVSSTTILDSTFSSNNAFSGGGIGQVSGKLTIGNCTFAGNRAGGGGGGGGLYISGGSTEIGSSIIAGNSATAMGAPNSPFETDVNGPVSSDGYNLIGTSDDNTGFTSIGDQLGPPSPTAPINPNLAPLRDNGGPTDTMALLPGSLAIDQGNSSFTTDQRGRRRFDNAAIPNAAGGDGSDIGAYEVDPPPIVTNNADSGTGSLRDVILATAPGETVNFAPNVTGVIRLTSGEIGFGKNLTINGPGATILTISGSNASRVFNITSGTVNISGLTIANGFASGGNSGGGIANNALLTLTNCALSNDNAPGGFGGGIYNTWRLTLLNCTVSGCSATDGGALCNLSLLSVINSTLSGNTATLGGVLYQFNNPNDPVNNPSIKMSFSQNTIAGNTATDSGGGIYNTNTSFLSTSVASCIIAGNSAPQYPDLYGFFQSGGYNLVGKSDGSSGFGATGDQVGTAASPKNPLLGPLQNNGGPTLTMALLPGSPAIDKGSNSAGLSTDQRGVPRTFDLPGIPNAADASDIGAYEVQSSWQTYDISVGSDNQVHLLWGSATNQYGLWNVNTSFNPTGQGPSWSPGAGWSAKAISTAGNGLTSMLWTRTDGSAGIWKVDSSFNPTYGPVWTPGGGWSASDVSLDSSGSSHILWTNSNGQAGLWTVDSAFNVTGGPAWAPGGGWTAKAIASGGAGGLTTMLWTNSNGQAGIWRVNSAFTPTYGPVWSPGGGWSAADIGVDSGGITNILWTNSDGHFGLWKVDSSFNVTGGPSWGPYPGWSARRVTAGGSDGTVKILLVNQDGHTGYWSVNGGFGVTGGPAYGPY